jgi:hypothetical protein
MPGDGLTHGPPANKKAGGSDHRFSRINRHSLRNGFTAYMRSPRCAGLFSSVARKVVPHEIDSSVGESGPRAFGVRLVHRSSCEIKASIASRTQRS